MTYIEREASMKKLKISLDNDKHFTSEASRIHQQEHRHLIHLIEKLPAADVAPIKHGKWVPNSVMIRTLYAENHHCSICLKNSILTSKYCPNCGAKMDSED